MNIKKVYRKLNRQMPMVALMMAFVIIILGLFALLMYQKQDARLFEEQITSMRDLQNRIEDCANDPDHEVTLHSQCVKARYMHKNI